MATATNDTSPHTGPHTGLTRAQSSFLVAYGIALWFGAAVMLRALEPLGVFQGLGVVLLYALLIPGTVPFIYLARRICRLRADQTVMAVTIATAAASLCDGTALVVMPALYGTNPAGAGAAILWGVGVGLILALVMNRPGRS